MKMQTLDKAGIARERGIYRVTIVGSVVNFLLLVFKFFAGIMGHSAAMLADAVHSLSDFVTDIIVLVFVRISSKPQDSHHRHLSPVCGLRHFLEWGFVRLSFLAGRLFARAGHAGTGSGAGIHRIQGDTLSIYGIQGEETEFAGGRGQRMASSE